MKMIFEIHNIIFEILPQSSISKFLINRSLRVFAILPLPNDATALGWQRGAKNGLLEICAPQTIYFKKLLFSYPLFLFAIPDIFAVFL